MKRDEQNGLCKVTCDKKLFDMEQIELPYILFQQEGENFSEHLAFVQEHFREMYAAVLKKLLAAYRKKPLWDIWDEESQTFLRIELQKEEDVHKYIGLPTIEIMSYGEKTLCGFSFWKNNRMSIEHGFCAVFEQHSLLLIGDSDFCNILRYWDYSSCFDITK